MPRKTKTSAAAQKAALLAILHGDGQPAGPRQFTIEVIAASARYSVAGGIFFYIFNTHDRGDLPGLSSRPATPP